MPFESMDFSETPAQFMPIFSMMLLLLLTSHMNLVLAAVAAKVAAEDEDDNLPFTMMEDCSPDYIAMAQVVVNHFCLWSGLTVVDKELGFWVKPRSTTWFSRFLLEEYDEERWLQLFRMTKCSVFNLVRLLSPHIRRQDTNYRSAVPVVVRVACVLFKLNHGATLLICSEMFAIGKSTVSIVLRKVVHAVNDMFKNEMHWPKREALGAITTSFRNACGLPVVAGAIDGTHFGIKKPKSCSSDYYYFKTSGFAMHCQAVVDFDKRFLDIFIGMPGSTNDATTLRRSTLFQLGKGGALWDADLSFDGFAPFLIRDGEYPLLPWLMIPHRRVGQLSMAESLFNRRLSKGQSVVENTFALLKTTFRELHGKSELSLFFLLDVVNACALLHNVLMQQSHVDVKRLLHVLQAEGTHEESSFPDSRAEGLPMAVDLEDAPASAEICRQLGWHLAHQRFP